MSIFDGPVSADRKEKGMEVAAAARESDLSLARSVAIDLARKVGAITADDVGKVMAEVYGIKTLGPAAGSIFKGRQWKFTGERRRSERKKNHARELKVWRLCDSEVSA